VNAQYNAHESSLEGEVDIDEVDNIAVRRSERPARFTATANSSPEEMTDCT
jgi:hypothetical protein